MARPLIKYLFRFPASLTCLQNLYEMFFVINKRNQWSLDKIISYYQGSYYINLKVNHISQTYFFFFYSG